MIRLDDTRLWPTIQALSINAKVRMAAVAFISNDKHIQFGSGDTVIVDASDERIALGATSAQVLAEAIKRGASIYSLANLHGKLMVFDDVAIVGSANISNASYQTLHEIGVVTDSQPLVRAAISIIRRLKRRSERINGKFLRHILDLPVKPPSAWPNPGRGGRGHKPSLLELLKDENHLLDDFVFTFWDETVTLSNLQIRREAKKKDRRLPPKDKWTWYEEKAETKLDALYKRLFVRRGLKTIGLQVECVGEGIVRVLELDPAIQIYINHFKIGKKLICNFIDDRHAPFSLTGRDATRLCLELTQRLQSDPRLGKRMYNKPGWIITNREMISLLSKTTTKM